MMEVISNKRVCIICNKQFDFWHSKAKTCGKECSKIYGRKLKELYKINNPDKVKRTSKKSYYKNKKPMIGICKLCNKEYVKTNNSKTCSEECANKNRLDNHKRNSHIWARRNPEKRKEVCRNYTLRNSEKLSKKSVEWARRNPDKVKAQVIKWRKNNRQKRNAEANAQNNVSIPEDRTCQICKVPNQKRIERHHPDYSKPLEVMFLCPKCHRRLHTGIIKISKEVCNE